VSEAFEFSFWDKVLKRLRTEISVRSFETWIRPLNFLALKDGEVVLGVPNSFALDWVEEHLRTDIQTAVSSEFGRPAQLTLVIQPRDGNLLEDRAQPAPVRPAIRQVGGLNPRYTFESFVVGPSNQFACAAARAVAEQPGERYNPLFIYGGVGLGKTHVAHAIGHRVQQQIRDLRVHYITAENFMIAMIHAIQRGRSIEFKSRFRSVDVLLIDDIEFLAGKESTQEEFFHTFNTLHEAHKQIVITCDSPPKELKGLEDRLISRFGCGLVTDIQPPDLETRVAILRKHAEFHKLTLRDDVALFIAENIKSNIRDLEGCLVRLKATPRDGDHPIDLAFAQQALNTLFRSQRRALNPRRITEVVSQVFNVDLEEIKSKKRTSAVALARQSAMALIRLHTGMSLADIGKEFGGRDHTTVMHACDRIRERAAVDADLSALMGEASRVLGVQWSG
jgi:chromosomal replication initiator protein